MNYINFNIDFIDSLCIILAESNFTKEFFIVYDKNLKRILPYYPPDSSDKSESLVLQAVSIHLKDKNKYYVIHSSEFPMPLLDKKIKTKNGEIIINE